MSVDSGVALPKKVTFSVRLVVCSFLLGVYGTWGHGAELSEAQTPAGQHALRREEALKEAEAARKDIEATIGRCANLGYWQQLEYHQARLAVEEEVIRRWELDGKIATLAESGKPVPEAMARELEGLERNDAIRTLVAEALGQIPTLRYYQYPTPDPDAEVADTAFSNNVIALENELANARARLSELTEVPVYSATEEWADAQERITSAQKPYGWHVAKLTLLRDLIHRTQRLRFYLTSSVGTDDQEQRLAAMVPAGSPLEDIVIPRATVPESFPEPGLDPFGQRLKRIEYETQRFRERGYFFKQPIAVNAHGSTPVVHESFLDEHKDDPDILMPLPGGGHRPGFPNFWHPAVPEMIEANLRAIAGYCKKQPGFMYYDKLLWEAYAALKGPGWQIGYNNRYALAAFREYLKQKFGGIERLNQQWRSAYDRFEAIQLPDHSLLDQPRLRTPLIYEFEAFQRWSWVEYVKMCAEAVRQEDPSHPILSEVRMGLPYLQASQLPVQYLDSHRNNAVSNYAATHWLYDLCLHTGKLPAEDEYIWTYPRTQALHTEQDVRVNSTLSVWRKMVWGYKILEVFAASNGSGYNNGLTDERYTVLGSYQTVRIEKNLLREAATAITLGKKRAREFWPILSRTEVAQPSVGLVADSAEVKWHQTLTPRDHDFRYLPQQLIVDKPQVLSHYRLLILPLDRYGGASFPDGLDAALLKWVQSGGTLICSGIPGMYDKYGFESGALMKRVFGEEITYQYTGTDDSLPIWKECRTWNIQVPRQDSHVTIELSREGGPALISARFGEGRVLVSAEPLLGTTLIHHRMQDILFAYMDRAVGLPTASSNRHRFEMVMREDSNGQRYLFIVNPNIDQQTEDLVVVKGEYRQVIDLEISSVCAIPLIPREPVVVHSPYHANCEGIQGQGGLWTEFQAAPGTTSFFMRLQPGEGTVLKLIP